LELVPVDNDQAPGVGGKIISVVAIIEMIVKDNGRTVVVAQSAPAIMVISMVPMDPSRTPTPMIMGNPVPAKAHSPAPAAIMIRAPAPWLVRYPCPADDGVPDPAPIVIRPPIIIANRRNPHISVGRFIGPAAVARKLVLIIVIIFGEICPRHALRVKRISAGVPIAEIIAARRERKGRGDKPAVGRRNPFAVPDLDRAFLPGRLGRATISSEFGFFVLEDIHPEQAGFHDVERRVGRVNFKIFLPIQSVNS
jgi:hypothetical protein